MSASRPMHSVPKVRIHFAPATSPLKPRQSSRLLSTWCEGEQRHCFSSLTGLFDERQNNDTVRRDVIHRAAQVGKVVNRSVS
jgi:hypothetical protein